jgi:mannose-1-phosphate guanylyltransferase / mannose-6-phosphate isomerase
VHTGPLNFSSPIIPVILSGGSGARLWPLSRSLRPKQLLPVTGASSMIRETARRVSGSSLFAAPIIVGGEDHRFLIARELAEEGTRPATILLEPEGRNTAPAIAIAAHHAVGSQSDPLLLVLPSDHAISDLAAFEDAVCRGVAAARLGKLVTFGIKPEAPETGYGYIAVGEPLDGVPNVHTIERFVEKPDAETALGYLDGGRHLWNGGIFLFSARAFLSELSQLTPQVALACEAAMLAAEIDGAFVRPGAEAFRSCPNISIDYAVMEKTRHAAVVPVDMGWSDVGSWDALWSISNKDDLGNATKGSVVAIDTSDSLLRVEGGAPIAALGLSEFVVVSTPDAVLIAPRARAQDVKRVVDVLKADGNAVHASHSIVHRPWGTYETTDAGDRFQTKRIVVYPGEKLSLQMHHHRSEHWIVVSGTARVTINGDALFLQEDQSAYIPAGSAHRLENPGKFPLHLIEVQYGAYLGEDDIVRFEDSYGRSNIVG